MSALVFDLDGTLVDSAPDMAEALNRVMAARDLLGFALAEVRGFVGNGVAMLIRRAMAARGRAGEAVFADWHDAYLAAYADCICVETRLYPGVAEVLDGLAGHRLAICTNKPQALTDALLEALDLRPRFAAVLGGDTEFGRKPDPAPLRQVAGLIGTADAVMVGDSMADAGAARAAGLPLILYTGGYRDRAVDEIAPDARFDHWDALPGLVPAMMERA